MFPFPLVISVGKAARHLRLHVRGAPFGSSKLQVARHSRGNSESHRGIAFSLLFSTPCPALNNFCGTRGCLVAGVLWFLFNNGHAEQPNNNLLEVYIFSMRFSFLKEIFKHQSLQFKPLKMMQVERNSTRNQQPTLRRLPP